MEANLKLQRMIDNRETELQRTYDNCVHEENQLKVEISELTEQIEIKRNRLKWLNSQIVKCVEKADEIGMRHVL